MNMNNPCKDCLLLPCCKTRIEWDSVIETARKEQCTKATEFFRNADQIEINETRKLFGLRELK